MQLPWHLPHLCAYRIVLRIRDNPSVPRKRPMKHSNELPDLMSQIALGNRAAFDTLYRHTSAHLLGVILRIQHNRAQAEDVLQEVYINVWRAARTFNASLSQPTVNDDQNPRVFDGEDAVLV